MPENERTSPLGVVGRQLVENVRELMAVRGLSLRQLSERLDVAGRPILPTVLHRLTSGGRRVDADDLIALGLALNVAPNTLLLPRHLGRDDVIELSPEVKQTAYITWGWALGRWPMPEGLWPEGVALSFPTSQYAEFVERNRPDFDTPDSDPVVAELTELMQLVSLILSDPDPASRWPKVRDTMRRQIRLASIRLEELFARLDGEADLPDSAGAVEQLRVVVGEARPAGRVPGRPRPPEPGPGAASTSADPDPHAGRGAASTIRFRPPTTDER